MPPVLLGLGIAACGIGAGIPAGARCWPRWSGAATPGWPELAAAAALALLMAGLGIAQERSAARGRARTPRRGCARPPSPGCSPPARPMTARWAKRAALVVDRIEALEGYFARWLPAALLAILAPLLVATAAAWRIR